MRSTSIQQMFDCLCLLVIAGIGLRGLYQFRDWEQLRQAGILAVITIGTLGLWRWSWYGIHVLRSRWYMYYQFQRWRRQANKLALADLPTVAIVVPTFHEQPWITEKVFTAIVQAAAQLERPTTVVAVTSEEEIIAIKEIFDRSGVDSIQFVPVNDPGKGKRGALAAGLRAAVAYQPEVVALMDGDCVLSTQSLSHCLPFFQTMPKLGGLTTDETVEVKGSRFFYEWLLIRFAQRHLYMCSHALSRKVLCLTGRFSLFRGEAALEPSFAALIERDTINDWLWGEFQFLSGDDKSSWFWILRAGYEMIYVPDVTVHTIETLDHHLWSRMYQNMRRWFGNMIRSGNRAIVLGPTKVGAFIWFCLIDQRISFWTSLTAPSLLLIYSLRADWTSVGLICSWLLFSRPLSLLVLGWGRPLHLKPIHVLQVLLAQWSSSLIKIFTQMHLAQQRWANRGDQQRDAAGAGLRRMIKLSTARFLLMTQVCGFAIIMLSLIGIITPNIEFKQPIGHFERSEAKPQPVKIFDATRYGVIANDDRNDTPALQTLIDRLPPTGLIQINLPNGEIQLDQPLTIHRSHTHIHGQGAASTMLICRQTGIKAIAKTAHKPLVGLELSNLTMVQRGNSVIVLQHVRNSTLKSIRLAGSGNSPTHFIDTQNIQLEYIGIEGQFQPAIAPPKHRTTQTIK
jgi:mannuronan synthase